MTLSDAQWMFLKDIARLILWAADHGWKLTGGEFKRTEAQEKIYVAEGKSRTMNSKHLESMALDFQGIWPPGATAPIQDRKHAEPLGIYWESLSTKNVWGGRWKTLDDSPHFQRSFP
jgi:hypothetical protein